VSLKAGSLWRSDLNVEFGMEKDLKGTGKLEAQSSKQVELICGAERHHYVLIKLIG
jgi:hypothetical protein